MKKAFLNRAADILANLGVVGLALAIFEGNSLVWPAVIAIVGAFILTYLAKKGD